MQRLKHWGEWLTVMHEELEALKAKEVYEEVDNLLPGCKAIKSKWVLHIKQDKEGQISRFKGHLVAKGFTQVQGQDSMFRFTPVTRGKSTWPILSIATLKNLKHT